MNEHKEDPIWPPVPSNRKDMLSDSRSRGLGTIGVRILLGFLCGSTAYAISLLVLLVSYVALVLAGGEIRHYSFDFYQALFVLKNCVWYSQRFIVFIVPVLVFRSQRHKRFLFAISFAVGSFVSMIVLWYVYPFVPLAD